MRNRTYKESDFLLFLSPSLYPLFSLSFSSLSHSAVSLLSLISISLPHSYLPSVLLFFLPLPYCLSPSSPSLLPILVHCSLPSFPSLLVLSSLTVPSLLSLLSQYSPPFPSTREGESVRATSKLILPRSQCQVFTCCVLKV